MLKPHFFVVCALTLCCTSPPDGGGGARDASSAADRGAPATVDSSAPPVATPDAGDRTPDAADRAPDASAPDASPGDSAMPSDTLPDAGTPPAAPTTTVLGGATGQLGSCRIGAVAVTATEATISSDAGQATVTQVVAPGQLLVACAQLYRVARIVPAPGGSGPGSATHSVVIETTPVTVPGVSLRPTGLVLAIGGRLYLAPVDRELSELALTGTQATFKVGDRLGGPTTTAAVEQAATVTVGTARYGVVVVPPDPARGLVGWIELIPAT
jgi:hypothetical protein